ncbi:hypothetical protein HLB23_01495 [Nocardia uniformis]|uniref:Uncharacterized protein n=1 Tax=Nocardia uniformis TaxID=53432 RepID=A0A849BY16_9NOCA|nr:hypothetical protein [Nocardia uniformis]NNH68567.1 hypothetical protein [Nocardia uniformis]
MAGQPFAPMLGENFDLGACSVVDRNLVLEKQLRQDPQPGFLMAGFAAVAKVLGGLG